MPKHEAATWFEDADAETRSCHSVQMLRHRGDRHDAETRALTVSSQGRHSQRAQFTWPKQPVNCDAETTSAAM
jgi:hypothetical protein